MPAFAGLQTNLLTWLILVGTTVGWVISVRLVPGWAYEGWPSLLKSLYGFVWLGFGLDILLRFLMLSYNAVEWGNGSPRLVVQTVDTVNVTLAYCGLFWLLVALAYRFAVRRKGAGPLGIARMFIARSCLRCRPPSGAALLRAVLFDGWPNKQSPAGVVTPLLCLGISVHSARD